jgi:adenine-specific DNA-methyltransferase
MKTTTLDGKTPDIAEENIGKLKQLFPEVFTEGKVDFEKLQQVLGEYVEDSNERYNFTWNGKGRALRLSQTPSLGTLRPCKEESKDWDTTQNLYIEGDNLEVLKLLQKSYYAKVKMIYIDPPYNSGKDFVYMDDFRDSIENYKKITGQIDSEGKAISTNTETSGRYHTDWLNMMYPRLRLARNLLTDDGVIFISIDDTELHNLRKTCDEIFGEDNFIACIIWERAYSPVNLKKHFSENHDFILCYAKSIDNCICNGIKRSDDANDRYKNPDNDPRGPWKSSDLSVGPIIEEKVYEITTPSGRKVYPPNGYCWRLTKERFEEFVNDNRIWFGEDGNNVPSIKRFLSEVKDTITPMTIWKYAEVGHSQDAKQKLKDLFEGASYFDYPKSIDLIKRMIELYTSNESIILDFFSGSSTTAHAVMQLNAEDGGNRKFIMVQLPEPTVEKSDAYKAGYTNICEIGKERIRRAGEKIKEEKGLEALNLDVGFKVLKLDSSNIRKWQPDYNDLEQSLMDYVDNYVEGRTELDVVYEIMIKYGLDLTYPVDEFTVAQKKVYSIGFGMLMICLDDEITIEVAKGILGKIKELSPESSRVVFKDNGFKSDSNKTNIKEILKSGGIEEFITI